MGKVSKQPQGDILDEKYKGANAAVAAAGEAYFAHYWMALIGLVGGMAGALLFHKNIAQQLDQLRNTAASWVSSKNAVTRFAGETVHGIFGIGRGYLQEERDGTAILIKEIRGNEALSDVQRKMKIEVLERGVEQIKTKERGFGYWLLSHTVYKIPGARDKLANVDGINTAVAAGGLLGAIGFFVAPWIYALKGVHNAHGGKDQFKRAQLEIKDLREDRDFLEQRNTELRNELRTTKEGRIHVSGDQTNDTPDAPEVLARRKDDAQHEEHQGGVHTRHTHHSDGHQQHVGKSHGDVARERHAASNEHAHGVGA